MGVFRSCHGWARAAPRSAVAELGVVRRCYTRPMNEGPITPIIVGAFALLIELVAFMRCATHGIPFSRGFALSASAQFALPVLVLAVFALWNLVSPPSHGVEPLAGEAFARSWLCMGVVFWAEVAATLAAVSFAVSRFFVSAPANDNSRNA